MIDSYFKYELVYITFGIVAIAFLFIGCSQPNKPIFVEGENIEYVCKGNGYWYMKTSTTKLKIMKDGNKYLSCGDERL